MNTRDKKIAQIISEAVKAAVAEGTITISADKAEEIGADAVAKMADGTDVMIETEEEELAAGTQVNFVDSRGNLTYGTIIEPHKGLWYYIKTKDGGQTVLRYNKQASENPKLRIGPNNFAVTQH